MTERVNYLTVALERNLLEEDAQRIVKAICLLRGVLSVHSNVADPDSFVAEERAKRELGERIWSLIEKPTPSEA